MIDYARRKASNTGGDNYLDDLYEDQPFSNILLEEVELEDEQEDDAHYWLITIGFTDPKAEPVRGPLTLSTKPPRRYKQFKINADTGEVKSMRIRAVENA